MQFKEDKKWTAHFKLLPLFHIIGRLLALRKVIGNYTTNAQHDSTLVSSKDICRIKIKFHNVLSARDNNIAYDTITYIILG